MHVLVIGGTRFVGRAIVEELLARGHHVTLANRGLSNDGVFSCRVTTIHLDRLDSLAPLGSGTWDSCIDTCAYIPRAVRMVGEALHGRVGRYVLISTISVYANPEPGANEDAQLIEDGDPCNEVVDAQTYGYLKVLCEREAIRQFPDQTTVIRPGIVVGPHDPTDRFTYWVHRIATEPAVLYPAKESAVQWIDARDLAWLVVDSIEQPPTTVHAVGNHQPLLALLEEMRATLNPDCHLVPVPMEEEGIQPWTDFPMVPPEGDAIFRLDPARAFRLGLRPRPTQETVEATHHWFAGLGRDVTKGLTIERSREILSKLDS